MFILLVVVISYLVELIRLDLVCCYDLFFREENQKLFKKYINNLRLKKKKGFFVFKDFEVVEEDCNGGCFDVEDYFKVGEGKNNIVFSFLKNVFGIIFIMLQKGGKQLRFFKM